MDQGYNPGDNKGASYSHSDPDNPQNENNSMNEFNPLPNPLGYDINLNSSYQHNNEEVCIFQNDNNFSYLNEGNCQDQSINIYNQCDEEKMEINEEQQDKINEKKFKEELEKQKEEKQSLKFDLKDYCVEKEMQQSGNELIYSFLDEQLFLNDILLYFQMLFFNFKIYYLLKNTIYY